MEVEIINVKFCWLVCGWIIFDFGVKFGGGCNEGVNFVVLEGILVKVVDDGMVIYFGNELKGYGNLVLLCYDEGWVFVYVYNSVLNVKCGDKICWGDMVVFVGVIGLVI